jgi:hypothetical protein
VQIGVGWGGVGILEFREYEGEGGGGGEAIGCCCADWGGDTGGWGYEGSGGEGGICGYVVVVLTDDDLVIGNPMKLGVVADWGGVGWGYWSVGIWGWEKGGGVVQIWEGILD